MKWSNRNSGPRWMALVLLVLSNAAADRFVPLHSLKTTTASLLPSYDFVICGAGTTGLTIADRLSSAFPSKNILVVEYGQLEPAPGVFDPPTREYTPLDIGGARASSWDFVSLPSPALNNGTAFVKAGKAVGGSSAINGQFFDRASKHDFDDGWSPLQISMTDKKVPIWDWKGIEPFYKKSVKYTPPGKDLVEKYGYTWDEAAWNDNSTSSKIQATMAAFLWADHSILRRAFRNMGIWLRRECMDGNKEGICWTPNSQDPMTGERSFAGSAHYTQVVANRSNYHLLVGHQVTRVVFPHGLKSGGWGGEVPLVEVRSVSNATQTGGQGQGTFNITATGEVIISAGALHSPAILQRSGIGPADFLKQLNIPMVVDLPGVGSNLQDHSGPTVEWNYSRPLNIHPMPPDMSNSTFLSEAQRGWNQRPARGPYTIAMSMTSIWVPLTNISANYTFILDEIDALVSLGLGANLSSSNPSPKTLQSLTKALSLPPSYASSPTLLYGYISQLSSISSLLRNPKSPSLESAFTTGTSLTAVLNHPLSRGTVRIDPSSPLNSPILDYRSASNPVDLSLHLLHTQYLRRTIPALQFLFSDPEAFASLLESEPKLSTLPKNLTITETQPGPSIPELSASWNGIDLQQKGNKQLLEWVKKSTVQSFMHPCCTNAMLPLEKGGVVDTHLRVHNAGGRLRVADASIFPLEPSSHLSSLCYAVGEKVADMIIKEWSE